MNLNTPVANILGSKVTSGLGIAYLVMGVIMPVVSGGMTLLEAIPHTVIGLMGLFAKN